MISLRYQTTFNILHIGYMTRKTFAKTE